MTTHALQVRPVTLEGRHVVLEPAEPRHAASLARHATPETFRYFLTLRPAGQTEGDLADFIARSRALPHTLTFAIVWHATGEPVGTTSYMDIRPDHRGLEIGMTWVAGEHRGTVVNPEAKLLLLEHAFERLECVRVQLKTDGRNLQSQRAIEKLGGVREGVLRKHLVLPDGFVRDTVMYSILAEEWPDVRRRLEERIAALGG